MSDTKDNKGYDPATQHKNGRNRCLDFFKGIAALGVVFVHITFPGIFGKCISAIGSCGVMLFFLISGHYAYGSRDEMCPKLMKRFRRNLLLTVTAVLIYFCISVWQHMKMYHDLNYWLQIFRKPGFYIRMIYCSDLEAICGDPLWFMFALLHAYIIFWVMYRLRMQSFAKYAMPLFILLRIAMETYKYAVDGSWRICSNVLVAALPLMLLGFCIAEWKEKLMKLPVWSTAVCGIVSMICVFLLIIYDPFRYNITQIFKLTAVASVFLFALKKPSLRLFPPLSSLGGAYSLHVYLWHMPVIIMMYTICERYNPSSEFYSWYLPLIVAAVSVFISVIIVTVHRTGKKLLFISRNISVENKS